MKADEMPPLPEGVEWLYHSDQTDKVWFLLRYGPTRYWVLWEALEDYEKHLYRCACRCWWLEWAELVSANARSSFPRKIKGDDHPDSFLRAHAVAEEWRTFGLTCAVDLSPPSGAEGLFEEE